MDRLTLRREALHELDIADLAGVQGGTTGTISFTACPTWQCQSRIVCYSVNNCLTEACLDAAP